MYVYQSKFKIKKYTLIELKKPFNLLYKPLNLKNKPLNLNFLLLNDYSYLS